MFPSLIGRASVRYFRHHPWQFGLTLVGIALGVAVVSAVDLASQSARRAFELSSDAVLGRTSHQIVGVSRGVPESVYVELKTTMGDLPAAPVIEAPVRTPGSDVRRLTLMGVDPLAELSFRGRLAATSRRGTQMTLLVEPMSVALSESTAARLGVGLGERLAVIVNGRQVQLRVALLMSPRRALERQGLENLLIADLSTAQAALGNPGYLTRIDLKVETGVREVAVLDRVRALLPSGSRIVATGARTRATAEMTRAFDLNLYMFGLLALVVGMFLIFNAMTFSVLQRRALIGRLRALGATRREILGLVLLEATVLGLAGALLGLVLGTLLAQKLVVLIAQTINDLYYSVHVSGAAASPWILAKCLALGVAGSLLAAALPALEAARTPPGLSLTRFELERKGRSLLPVITIAGLVFLVASALIISWPRGNLAAGFVALFLLVLGFALLAPYAMVVLLRIVQPLAGRMGGDLARVAVRGVGAHLSRTGVAVAALMVAIAATAGVGVMVDSFRRSVDDWLSLTLRADIYISVPGVGNLRAMGPEAIARIRETPGVAELSMGRRLQIEMDDGQVDVLAIHMAPQSYAGFRLLTGEPTRTWRQFDEAGAVLVSEPFAWRRRVEPGQSVRLLTASGFRAFEVAGVYRDYGSDQGVVLMSRQTFARYWKDAAVTTLGVYAEPGADLAALRGLLEVAARGEQSLDIHSTGAIRALSLEVFDRTFTITNVLRLLAVVIAFVGILSALMAIQLELGREFAVLRALGLTRAQLFGIAQSQTGLLGLAAGLLALPLGVLLALILVEVINRRAFGWSLDFHVDPGLLAQALALSVCAALLAGIYPAYRIAVTPPAEVLREE